MVDLQRVDSRLPGGGWLLPGSASLLPWSSLFAREWFFEDSCGIRQIFWDFSEVYAFGRLKKVVGGRRGLKGSGS